MAKSGEDTVKINEKSDAFALLRKPHNGQAHLHPITTPLRSATRSMQTITRIFATFTGVRCSAMLDGRLTTVLMRALSVTEDIHDQNNNRGNVK